MQKQVVCVIISSSVSCYKALEVIRMLIKNNIEVLPILTCNAQKMLSPSLVSAISDSECYTNSTGYSANSSAMPHIAIARRASAILVCPATANTIAKLAAGFANELAIEVPLACGDTPVLVCPAMNTQMWAHPSTQQNISNIQGYGYEVIMPESGLLACGESGPGKLADINEISRRLFAALNAQKKYVGKVLITLGGTVEKLDDFRHISNLSSGIQGAEIAEECIKNGFEVSIIHGSKTAPMPPACNSITQVESARQMYDEVMRQVKGCDAFFSVAAVGDYYHKNYQKGQKLQKQGGDITITLAQNADILQEVSHLGEGRPRVVVGFAAEATSPQEVAKKKLEKKGCDFMYANTQCFGLGSTSGALAEGQGAAFKCINFSGTKTQLAALLIQKVVCMLTKGR